MFAGWHCYVWPRDGWAKLDLPKVAADCKALGYAGVVLHSGLYVAREVASGGLDTPFRDAGLAVALGVGFPKPRPGANRTIAQCIQAALDVPDAPVVLDWEGSWDGHADDARAIADAVLAARPAAPARVTHACWWAPLTLPNGRATHPSAPTDEFMRLTADNVPVVPQCYNDGYQVGETAWQLRWARRCYAPRPVVPTVQAYAHGLTDRAQFVCDEPDGLAWDYVEQDALWRRGLRAGLALRARGCSGPAAILAFQKSAGLTADGVVGAKTLAALGA